MTKEQKLTVLLLKEKIEKLSGKKVVFESAEKQIKIKKLIESLEKISGKKVIFEAAEIERKPESSEPSRQDENIEEGLGDIAKSIGSGIQKGAAAVKSAVTGNPDEATARQNYLNTIALWKRQGYIAPTQAEFDAIMTQARADKFAGKLGSDASKKIVYRPASGMKWGHTQGMGPGA